MHVWRRASVTLHMLLLPFSCKLSPDDLAYTPDLGFRTETTDFAGLGSVSHVSERPKFREIDDC